MLTKWTKTCAKTVAGNDYKLYAGRLGDISSAAFSGNTLTGITMDASAFFVELEADWDSVTFTDEATATTGFFSTQNLTARFSQKTAALEAVVDELSDAAVCGLVLIRKDGNGNLWISGVAPLAKMAANRPYLTLQSNFSSGENLEAVEDGNKYSLTFTRVSATREFDIDSSLAADIVAGTATFIDYV